MGGIRRMGRLGADSLARRHFSTARLWHNYGRTDKGKVWGHEAPENRRARTRPNTSRRFPETACTVRFLGRRIQLWFPRIRGRVPETEMQPGRRLPERSPFHASQE